MRSVGALKFREQANLGRLGVALQGPENLMHGVARCLQGNGIAVKKTTRLAKQKQG